MNMLKRIMKRLSPNKEKPQTTVSSENFIKHLKKKLVTSLCKIFQKIKEGNTSEPIL
jgi:hypothetical protein